MPHEIETWIDEAVATLGLSVERLSVEEAERVQYTARSLFVNGTPRAWWESLRQPCEHYDSTQVSLDDVLPDNDAVCWFIPETDEARLPVYSVKGSDIIKLVNECPFFECYVIGKQFEWLLVESDHNAYFVCRGAAS